MAPFLLPIGDKVTATSSITVEVNAQRALVTLQDIKRNTENATNAIDKLRAAASGGFGRLEQALGRLENPLQKLLKEMQAMRAGMSGGTEAALKQARAMDQARQDGLDQLGQMERAIKSVLVVEPDLTDNAARRLVVELMV